MTGLLLKTPLYKCFRRFGRPRLLPSNLTLGLTYRCNSRCRTCRVWEKEEGEELGLSEYERIFDSLGRAPYWVVLSGGEPFLRNDLERIAAALCARCAPRVITLPTNGLSPGLIPSRAAAMADRSPRTRFIVNVSIDELGARHDAIRGVEGSYERAVATFTALKALGRPNIIAGIHTVVSRFNAERFPEIYEALNALEPNSYVAELAEQREELGTTGAALMPDAETAARLMEFLAEKTCRTRRRGTGAVIRAVRIDYYELAKRWLGRREQPIPCYAGFISAQIAPDGEVWACCTGAASMGNLREHGGDFGKVWRSDRANRVRAEIAAGRCSCPLASASFTSMLCRYRTLARVAASGAVAPFRRESKE